MSTETNTPPTFGEIMDKAAKSALRGGTAGAVAMGLNVGALMWMRTTVSYIHHFIIYILVDASIACHHRLNVFFAKPSCVCLH